jgi:hypothetical protein
MMAPIRISGNTRPKIPPISPMINLRRFNHYSPPVWEKMIKRTAMGVGAWVFGYEQQLLLYYKYHIKESSVC